MTEPLKVLVVEDNHDIAENIVMYLEACGHQLDVIHSGMGALNLLQTHTYDVLLLDVMLPGMDGFTLAKKIRKQLKLSSPILFLTARDALDDKVEGFSQGGDDYLTKPFEMLELEMRIMALSKRAKGHISDEIIVANCVVDTNRRQIIIDNVPLKTTNIAYKIFKILAQSYPKILSKSDLEWALWQDEPPESDALRSHIFVLRKAIKQVSNNVTLETVHSIGYRLDIATGESQ